ncbi:MAG: UDP-N-acetylglucosamine 2-epimerase [Xanthobacteraceae bacterium]|jgi:UDP-hydrolysing UDP-N-acetyl-D-glucosamine 2-epimerase
MAHRKICIVTGSRADYGLLFWLLKEVQQDPRLELQLLVTGSHLAPEFGLTVEQIRSDGFPIAGTVEMLVSSDSAVGMAKSIGLGVIGFADALHRASPDLVVVLGDRFEIFAAAQAAMAARIPLAHIHGGEVTEGAIDEQMRHAITKIAHLHFVTAEPHRKRVIQMGERPENVHLVGAPGLDNIAFLQLLDQAGTQAALGFELGNPTFLVTYHPATLGGLPPERAAAELLAALDAFPESHLVVTMPNADSGGRAIGRIIEQYVERHSDRARSFTSLGQVNYLSAMQQADVIIGNSSSGLIEAPALGKPTVNVGPRQQGRLRGQSVIDCAEDRVEIRNAIGRALSAEFRAHAATVGSPYGTPGQISSSIKNTLAEASLGKLMPKRFADWNIPA